MPKSLALHMGKGSRLLSSTARFLRLVLVAWVLFVVTPAVLQPSRTAIGQRSALAEDLLGSAGASYLAYCPPGLSAFALATLVMGPLLVVLMTLALPRPRHTRSWCSLVARLLVTVAAVTFVTVSLLWAREVWASSGAAAVAKWAWVIGVFVGVATLPAVGTGLLIVSLAPNTSWRSLLGSAAVVALLGIAGRVTGASGFPSPWRADTLLFSGVGGNWYVGAGIHLAWFAALSAASYGTMRLRQRRLPKGLRGALDIQRPSSESMGVLPPAAPAASRSAE